VRGRWDKSCGAEDIAYVPPPENMRLAPELGAAPAAPVAAPRLVADLWADAGGKLRGRVVEDSEPAAGRRAAGSRWSSEVATPLVEVMREMNKTSNNLAARSLLLSLGSDAPARTGVLPPRRRACARGCARRASPMATSASTRARASRAPSAASRARWSSCSSTRGAGVASQAVRRLAADRRAVDGTLRHRMRSGAASGQAFLKTGTLSDTRALAGYVRGRSGRLYAVAAIVDPRGGREGHAGARRADRMDRARGLSARRQRLGQSFIRTNSRSGTVPDRAHDPAPEAGACRRRRTASRAPGRCRARPVRAAPTAALREVGGHRRVDEAGHDRDDAHALRVQTVAQAPTRTP
jgi:hypothetical protein